jgi:hypothetical protein
MLQCRNTSFSHFWNSVLWFSVFESNISSLFQLLVVTIPKNPFLFIAVNLNQRFHSYWNTFSDLVRRFSYTVHLTLIERDNFDLNGKSKVWKAKWMNWKRKLSSCPRRSFFIQILTVRIVMSQFWIANDRYRLAQRSFDPLLQSRVNWIQMLFFFIFDRSLIEKLSLWDNGLIFRSNWSSYRNLSVYRFRFNLLKNFHWFEISKGGSKIFVKSILIWIILRICSWNEFFLKQAFRLTHSWEHSISDCLSNVLFQDETIRSSNILIVLIQFCFCG